MQAYPGLTVEGFYDLTLAQHRVLLDHLNKQAEAQRG
jgi:hypothetical protein